jgi:hypothetical protein
MFMKAWQEKSEMTLTPLIASDPFNRFNRGKFLSGPRIRHRETA